MSSLTVVQAHIGHDHVPRRPIDERHDLVDRLRRGVQRSMTESDRVADPRVRPVGPTTCHHRQHPVDLAGTASLPTSAEHPRYGTHVSIRSVSARRLEATVVLHAV